MFQQKFISKRVQEAFGEPVGDPFGGPAYNKKEFIGIALAIGGAISGGMALAAGGLSILGTIAAGAALVGGALTAIGMVTGDADLANIGKTIGIIGGVANLATNFDSIVGGFESVFGGGSNAAASATDVFGEKLQNVYTGPIDDWTSNATGAINIPQGAADAPASAPSAPVDGPVELDGLLSPQPKVAGDYFDIGNVAQESTGTANISSSPVDLNASVANLGGTGSTTATGATSSEQSAAVGSQPNNGYMGPRQDGLNISDKGEMAGSTGILSDIGSFIKNNKELVNMFGEGMKYMTGADKRKADQLLTEAMTGNKQAETELMQMKTQIMNQQALNANTVVNPGLLAANQNPNAITRPTSVSTMRPAAYA